MDYGANMVIQACSRNYIQSNCLYVEINCVEYVNYTSFNEMS